jgi:hypothetical protein
MDPSDSLTSVQSRVAPDQIKPPRLSLPIRFCTHAVRRETESASKSLRVRMRFVDRAGDACFFEKERQRRARGTASDVIRT